MKKYFSFQGRASRREWWAAQLSFFLLFPLVLVIEGLDKFGLIPERVAEGEQTPNIGFVVITLDIAIFIGFSMILWISVATTVRRLHDQDRTGWLAIPAYLINLIPVLGSIAVMFFLGVMRGDSSDNQYGKQPYSTTGTPSQGQGSQGSQGG
jgi:uncharacterized membrane protein YhaH (DUF805 family)